MHRHTQRAFSIVLVRIIACLLVAALPFAQQSRAQPRQTVPADEFAAGGTNCDWKMGACDMLRAYVSQGGSNAKCLAILQSAVELERQVQKLLQGAAQTYALNKQANDLQQQRDRVLATLPPDCFASGGRPNWPNAQGTNDGYPPPRPLPRPQPYPPPDPLPRPQPAAPPQPGGGANASGAPGCWNTLGQWIANGFCPPAQAAELTYNPAPANIAPGRYEIDVWTRPAAGYGGRQLLQVGEAVATSTARGRSVLTVSYYRNPETGRPYGDGGEISVLRAGTVAWNGTTASKFVFVPPGGSARGTLLNGYPYQVYVQQLEDPKQSGAITYNLVWLRPNKPMQEEQWVQLQDPAPGQQGFSGR